MVSLRNRVQKKGDKAGAEPVPATDADRVDVRALFPEIAATVAICGAASNAGKTWLCEAILRGLKDDGRKTIALKVTRTHIGNCPRGIDTCGTCDALTGDFELVSDRALLDVPRKDTGRYFQAGADRVLWLLVKPAAVRKGVLAALADVPTGFVLVAEGNSFRDYASSDVSLMALSASGEMKASARHVIDRVDACVRHYREGGRPARPSRADLPLLAAAEAWPFVRDRLGARLPA